MYENFSLKKKKSMFLILETHLITIELSPFVK